VCLHINWKGHAAGDLNIIVKGERHFNVTGSHVHWKTDNISEMVLDRDVVLTDHYKEVIFSYMTHLIAAIAMT